MNAVGSAWLARLPPSPAWPARGRPRRPSPRPRRARPSRRFRAAARRTSSSSASVSLGRRLMRHHRGACPQTSRHVAHDGWRRFGRPRSERLEVLLVPARPSPRRRGILSARTVATITTASGHRSAMRHLMSRNFSAPRSAPKPASVTAIVAQSFSADARGDARCCSRGRYSRTGRRARARACPRASAQDWGMSASLQQRRHRALRALRSRAGHGLAVIGVAHDDAAEPRP